MSDGGKGSAPRPLSVSQAEFGARYDAIFGRNQKPEPAEPEGYRPTIQDAMKALEQNNLDAAWHILRTIKNQTAYWRERALQAESELHTAKGQK